MKILQQIIAKYNHQDIIEYHLICDSGFQVNFLNYGGVITAIYTRDKWNNLANVVLSHKEFNPENPEHFGAITGRIAGRIASAQFKLEKSYNLVANDGPHNLHGGPKGLDKQIWNVEILANGARLSYESQDGESGFPGKIQFTVDYIIDNNQLAINYHAIPDRETIINLTNHSYFDLSTGKNPLLQELEIDANYYAEIDKTGIVSGNIYPVKNTPFDFSTPRPITQGIAANHQQLELVNGYDHPLILDKSKKIMLTDPVSGRYMRIITDQPVCIVYSANNLIPKHTAICLETQAMPNAINWTEFKNSVIYHPDKVYQSYNIWKFGVN